MKKRNTTQFGLLSELFLFILALSGTFPNTVQAQSIHPEGKVVRGERPQIDITMATWSQMLTEMESPTLSI